METNVPDEILKTLPLQNRYIHIRGLHTLFKKETKRFTKLFTQTIVAPLITNLLYLLIFGVSLKNQMIGHTGVSFLTFLIPGLCAMSIINNTFGNTTASVMGQKYQQTITELFFTPLAPWEIASAVILGGVMRGIVVAATTLGVCWFFSPFTLAHPFWILLSMLMLSIVFGGIGIVASLWADNFDKLSYFSTFFIAPFSFLGGVFFSIAHLPEPWHSIALLNPLLYFIDFFRWSCIGYSDISPMISGSILIVLTVATFTWVVLLYERGYKIKS
jgi:ABC-2 type transport system permease protein